MSESNRWNQYRVGKACLWGGFLLFIPAVVLTTYVLKAIGISGDPVQWLAFVWIVGWVVSALWLARFRCPQCDKRFFIHGSLGIGNLWAVKCCHCGCRPGTSAA